MHAIVKCSSDGRFRITSNDISPSAVDDSFDGTININDNGILKPEISGGWIFSGEMNLDSTGTGVPLVEASDIMTVDGGNIKATAGTSALNVPITFTGASSGGTFVATGATLQMSKQVVFQGGSSHDGEGTLEFHEATFTVDGDQTIKMSDGTVDLSADENEGEIWNLNADLTIQTRTLRDFGNNTSTDTDFIFIDNAAGATLTVELDNPADQWTLGPDGFINITGSASLGTSLAGADLNVEGDISIINTTRFTARVDVESGGTLIVSTPGHQLQLTGGSSVEPNTIDGGTITGSGELSSSGAAHLVGHGTINTEIDFNGGADLLASGGTLTVNGNVLDVDRLGTKDATGTLTLTQSVDTANFHSLQLNGGTINVTAINMLNNGTVQGHGQFNSIFFRNDGLIEATDGQTLTINTTNTINLDGANENGQVEAILGDVVITKALTDQFSGTITVGAGRSIEFQNGWTLATNGVLNLNGVGSTGTVLDGDGTTLRGTVNVSGRATIIGNTTFTSDVTVNMPIVGDLLSLHAETTIASGADFVGGLIVTHPSFTTTLADGADIGAKLTNQGLLQIGSSLGVATVADFQQIGNGTLEIEIGGVLTMQHDALLVDQGDAILDGALEVSLVNGFVPSEGEMFPFLVVLQGTLTGTFDTLAADLPVLPNNLEWFINYNPTNFPGVTLEVVAAGLSADFDNDGDVDGQDFLLIQRNDPALIPDWQSQYGSGSSLSAASATVPEPPALCLALFAFAALATRTRHGF